MLDKFERVVAGTFLLGVVACIAIISFGTLSSKEGAILSLLLTILSVIASWIYARIYAESQHSQAISDVKEMHSENLRTYALKAAEKVNNLSQQLNRLSLYIEEELVNSDYDTEAEALSAKEERLASSIHMIGMLKSINDTSLSDWQGVIGDEIEEQREEQEERIEGLALLVERAERLWMENQAESVSTTDLNNRIGSLRKELKVAVSGISGSHLPSTRTKKKVRREVKVTCPSCNTANSYVQRAKKNSVKNIVCSVCAVTLISRYSAEVDDFNVDQAGLKEETVVCPNASCNNSCSVMLDVQPYSKLMIACNHCDKNINLKRKVDGLFSASLQQKDAAGTINEEFIERVNKTLPDQPWPKDTHKAVAKELNCSNGDVQRATNELIQRGFYKQQINGKLYELKESKEK